MKKFNVFTGIDVSKSTLDFCIIDAKANVLIQRKTENNSQGIKLLLNHFKKLDNLAAAVPVLLIPVFFHLINQDGFFLIKKPGDIGIAIFAVTDALDIE